jgi:S-DNA-T family DNA segregation ATPase FtsK/SpoIIIE
VYVTGDPARARGLVRAIVAQLATFQAPDGLLVAVCTPAQLYDEWEWTKWLPHALHPEKTDAVGQVRLFAPSAISLEAILDDLLGDRPRFDPGVASRSSGPHIVVILDGGDTIGSNHLMTEGGLEGVTLLDLTSPPPRLLEPSEVIFDIDDAGRLTSETIDDELEVGQADDLSVAEAEALARQLAPMRLSASGPGQQALTTELGLAELLELGDPYDFDPADTWVPRPNRDRLRVRLGVRTDGTPIELDLKESAQDGMGPHGLLIGATGSGKSELLRTLVLGLAITHSSNTLNFVLVDFKGGATFAALDQLPHTSAVITNLADELPLVDRMTDALNGELLRRQELLRASGHYASLRDYERARQAGAPLDEVPTLLVVCDEFSELLSAKPDFIDMFVQIGRLGRSLGVHLLLASQRLEEGRLRGLDTHLSFRLGLRMFSATESRVVLGSADAYELPKAPGHGYLKAGTEPMTRFRAAYVSGVHRRASGRPSRPGAAGLTTLYEYSPTYLAPAEPDPSEPVEAVDDEDAVGESLLDILVERMRGRGKPAHQVWLPPLREPVPLDRLLPGLALDPIRGLTTANTDLRGSLRAVVGIVDRPIEQRHDPLVLELSTAAGHVVVVGGPQSGKSTALRSIITSLALTHTPAEVQFYCLDFGGGSLGALRDLPHTGWVASRQDPGAVRRTVAELRQLLLHRERQFAAAGLDSMAAYRRQRRNGAYADDPFGDVFLVIDGWATLRSDFEDLEEGVGDLAARGLSYGIHLVVTCQRWFDLRAAVRDLFGTRIELRLGDPADSAIDRKAALNVPAAEPGRGLTETKHQMLVALPRIDDRSTVDDLVDGVGHLVQAVAAAWTGPGAPPVRMLPALVPYEILPTDPARGLAIGVAEQDLGPVHLDITTEPNFILFGESESGKTGFLRMLAQRIVETYTPDQARIILIDYRRSLLDVVPPDYLVGYGTNLGVTETLISEVAAAMEPRLPGPDVTAEQLRNRSWWDGMELFVLVDDYDLVATPMSDPLQALLPYLPQARDIGLHLVLARRSGGAGRAMYQPLLTALRESGSPGVMLSGDREEGTLLGSVRPESLPPGRGWLVSRRGDAQLVQLAWLPPRT